MGDLNVPFQVVSPAVAHVTQVAFVWPDTLVDLVLVLPQSAISGEGLVANTSVIHDPFADFGLFLSNVIGG